MYFAIIKPTICEVEEGVYETFPFFQTYETLEEVLAVGVDSYFICDDNHQCTQVIVTTNQDI